MLESTWIPKLQTNLHLISSRANLYTQVQRKIITGIFRSHDICSPRLVSISVKAKIYHSLINDPMNIEMKFYKLDIGT